MITGAETITAAAAGADWPSEVPEHRRRRLRLWLWSGAGLTFLILIVGGVTRLTQSGLSIVDWDPLVGAVPPLNEADWREAFAKYRQYPEYQRLRRGMTMAEFRAIFFWEYLHRLIARGLGFAFLVPFVVFQLRGYFTPRLRRRVLVLFVLGAIQGFAGWFMVRSGLVDRPSVSHYRLAIHFSIALTIIGYCIWLIRELAPVPTRSPDESRPERRWTVRWIGGAGILLALQIVWGVFLAGLDAGLYFNSFPLMGGRLLPPGGFTLEPLLRNLVENPIAVQWVHRVLGTMLVVEAAAFVPLARRRRVHPVLLRLGTAFSLLVLLQYGLGVATLLLLVPVWLGVIHQATAVIIVGVYVVWLHQARRPAGPPDAGRSLRGAL